MTKCECKEASSQLSSQLVNLVADFCAALSGSVTIYCNGRAEMFGWFKAESPPPPSTDEDSL